MLRAWHETVREPPRRGFRLLETMFARFTELRGGTTERTLGSMEIKRKYMKNMADVIEEYETLRSAGGGSGSGVESIGRDDGDGDGQGGRTDGVSGTDEQQTSEQLERKTEAVVVMTPSREPTRERTPTAGALGETDETPALPVVTWFQLKRHERKQWFLRLKSKSYKFANLDEQTFLAVQALMQRERLLYGTATGDSARVRVGGVGDDDGDSNTTAVVEDDRDGDDDADEVVGRGVGGRVDGCDNNNDHDEVVDANETVSEYDTEGRTGATTDGVGLLLSARDVQSRRTGRLVPVSTRMTTDADDDATDDTGNVMRDRSALDLVGDAVAQRSRTSAVGDDVSGPTSGRVALVRSLKGVWRTQHASASAASAAAVASGASVAVGRKRPMQAASGSRQSSLVRRVGSSDGRGSSDSSASVKRKARATAQSLASPSQRRRRHGDSVFDRLLASSADRGHQMVMMAGGSSSDDDDDDDDGDSNSDSEGDGEGNRARRHYRRGDDGDSNHDDGFDSYDDNSGGGGDAFNWDYAKRMAARRFSSSERSERPRGGDGGGTAMTTTSSGGGGDADRQRSTFKSSPSFASSTAGIDCLLQASTLYADELEAMTRRRVSQSHHEHPNQRRSVGGDGGSHHGGNDTGDGRGHAGGAHAPSRRSEYVSSPYSQSQQQSQQSHQQQQLSSSVYEHQCNDHELEEQQQHVHHVKQEASQHERPQPSPSPSVSSDHQPKSSSSQLQTEPSGRPPRSPSQAPSHSHSQLQQSPTRLRHDQAHSHHELRQDSDHQYHARTDASQRDIRRSEKTELLETASYAPPQHDTSRAHDTSPRDNNYDNNNNTTSNNASLPVLLRTVQALEARVDELRVTLTHEREQRQAEQRQWEKVKRERTAELQQFMDELLLVRSRQSVDANIGVAVDAKPSSELKTPSSSSSSSSFLPLSSSSPSLQPSVPLSMSAPDASVAAVVSRPSPLKSRLAIEQQEQEVARRAEEVRVQMLALIRSEREEQQRADAAHTAEQTARRELLEAVQRERTERKQFEETRERAREEKGRFAALLQREETEWRRAVAERAEILRQIRLVHDVGGAGVDGGCVGGGTSGGVDSAGGASERERGVAAEGDDGGGGVGPGVDVTLDKDKGEGEDADKVNTTSGSSGTSSTTSSTTTSSTSAFSTGVVSASKNVATNQSQYSGKKRSRASKEESDSLSSSLPPHVAGEPHETSSKHQRSNQATDATGVSAVVVDENTGALNRAPRESSAAAKRRQGRGASGKFAASASAAPSPSETQQASGVNVPL